DLLRDVVGHEVVGNDVAGQLEPEFGDPVQHLPLGGERRRHHDVVDRDPIRGDHQQVVLPLVDLADLPRGVELQVCDRDRRHGARLYLASAMLLLMALPPEPAMSPLRQTFAWSLRPLGFLDRCRGGRAVPSAVTSPASQPPWVMTSAPAAIKALYREPNHGLPPGRNIFLEPILGSRSLLLLEGADHLAHRKLMLPTFHGER